MYGSQNGPVPWLIEAAMLISTLSIVGIAAAPLPWPVVAGEFAAAVAFALFLDGIKIPIFARLKIS
jgi:H+-transporting ATPase